MRPDRTESDGQHRTMIDSFAIIIGGMKCGTTSLFQYLAQHPQIAASNPKETHFFSRDENWDKGFDFYLTHWRWDPEVHCIALEASPSYTGIPTRPNAAERMATIRADFRLVYVLRDPIDRIESHRAHSILKGRATACLGDGVMPEWLSFSKYAMQLDAYRRHFAADRIRLVDFDDLAERPYELVRDICCLLGVDQSFAFAGLGTAHNVGREDHPLYTALTRIRPARAAAKLVPLGLKQKARNYLSKKRKFVPPLSANQLRMIERELRDDLVRLQQTYGFDTSKWLRRLRDASGA